MGRTDTRQARVDGTVYGRRAFLIYRYPELLFMFFVIGWP